MPCTEDADGDARLWHDTLFILTAAGLSRAVHPRNVGLMSVFDPWPAVRRSAAMNEISSCQVDGSHEFQ